MFYAQKHMFLCSQIKLQYACTQCFICSQLGLYDRRWFKYFFKKNKNIQIWCQIVHKNISNLVVKTVCELDIRARNYREKTECNLNGWVHACLRQVAEMCQMALFCVWRLYAAVDKIYAYSIGLYDLDKRRRGMRCEFILDVTNN